MQKIAFFGPFPVLAAGKKIFIKNRAPSHFGHCHSASLCKKSEKTNEPITRKACNRRTDGRNGQRLIYRTSEVGPKNKKKIVYNWLESGEGKILNFQNKFFALAVLKTIDKKVQEFAIRKVQKVVKSIIRWKRPKFKTISPYLGDHHLRRQKANHASSDTKSNRAQVEAVWS